MARPTKVEQLTALAIARESFIASAKEARALCTSVPSDTASTMKAVARREQKTADILGEIAELIGSDLYNVEG